jgi:hypothetical protein
MHHIRKWRRVMAVGCSHGDLVWRPVQKQALEFRRKFQPEIRFELGDVVDTACFRAGAAGTKDEARSPRDDKASAIQWFRQYEPNRVAWGNHCWRIHELTTHPKAIVSELASMIWNELQGEVNKLKAKQVDYDIEDGWFHEGGVYWGHGYMYNEQAVRDHAEMLGGPTVIAHLHAPQMVEGRTLKDTPSFCVGALADDKQLTYGRRRRASLRHGHGIVYGEMCETAAHLNLIRSANREPLVFPIGL